MGYIADTKWTKHDVTVQWLKNNNFKYSKEYSDKDSDAYMYTFPVYKYKILTLLECAIVIYLDTKDVYLKVFDSKTKETYPQFSYDPQNNHKKLVEKIEKSILEEFKKLGIVPLYDKNEAIKKVIKYDKKKCKFICYCPKCGEKINSKCSKCPECSVKLLANSNNDYETAMRGV